MYHLQAKGKEPKLRQYGPTMSSQHLFHHAVTRRLSPTISFNDVYFALLLDEMDRDTPPAKFDETGQSVPTVHPEFCNGMHHDRISDAVAELDTKYISVAPDT